MLRNLSRSSLLVSGVREINGILVYQFFTSSGADLLPLSPNTHRSALTTPRSPSRPSSVASHLCLRSLRRPAELDINLTHPTQNRLIR